MQRVASVYESVDDIDLLVGVMAETPRSGALIGPTLACVFGNQFYRVSKPQRAPLKNSARSTLQTARTDRFWYENFLTPSMSEPQLAAIRSTSLARLLCAAGGQQLVQPAAFQRADNYE